MVHNCILMETIIIYVMVSIGLFYSRGASYKVNLLMHS